MCRDDVAMFLTWSTFLNIVTGLVSNNGKTPCCEEKSVFIKWVWFIGYLKVCAHTHFLSALHTPH